MYITLKLKNQQLLAEYPPIFSGSVGVLKVVISGSGFGIRVLKFTHEDGEQAYTAQVTNGIAAVPAEVIRAPGFCISVADYDASAEDGTLLRFLPSEAVYIKVGLDGYGAADDAVGDEKSLVGQMLQAAAEAKAAIDVHAAAETLDHPDGCVTMEKIAPAAVTSDKLGADVIAGINSKADEQKTADALELKADKADTLSGYGIIDAYTKEEVDGKVSDVNDKVSKKVDKEEGKGLSKIKDAIISDAAAGGTGSAIAIAGYGVYRKCITLTGQDDEESTGEFYNLSDAEIIRLKNSLNMSANVSDADAIILSMYDFDFKAYKVTSAIKGSGVTYNYQTPYGNTVFKRTYYDYETKNAYSITDEDINSVFFFKSDGDKLWIIRTVGALLTMLKEKANKADTLAGYGIIDAYTKAEADTELSEKADITYVDKLIPKGEASGNPVTLTDHLEGMPLIDYKVYGNSVQDGTPSPESPVEIQSVGEPVTDEADEHYGKYRIPIEISGDGETVQAVNIYANEPLRKVGDYADYIDFENQKVVRNVNYIAFTGNDGWQLERQGEDYISCYTLLHAKQIGNTNILSNTFNVGASSIDINTIYGRSSNKAVSLCLSTEYATTLEEFKAFIKERYNTGTPIICYYQLETPTEEPITVPELTTPNSAVMHISSGTAIQPSQIDLTYYQDINKKLAELQTAITALGGV